ncbi:Hypothetical protein UVM_LOCUS149 [uncultured virus]|nr:Hypothetical protein UVM_LOCUS149 [uncultured virus]
MLHVPGYGDTQEVDADALAAFLVHELQLAAPNAADAEDPDNPSVRLSVYRLRQDGSFVEVYAPEIWAEVVATSDTQVLTERSGSPFLELSDNPAQAIEFLADQMFELPLQLEVLRYKGEFLGKIGDEVWARLYDSQNNRVEFLPLSRIAPLSDQLRSLDYMADTSKGRSPEMILNNWDAWRALLAAPPYNVALEPSWPMLGEHRDPSLLDPVPFVREEPQTAERVAAAISEESRSKHVLGARPTYDRCTKRVDFLATHLTGMRAYMLRFGYDPDRMSIDGYREFLELQLYYRLLPAYRRAAQRERFTAKAVAQMAAFRDVYARVKRAYDDTVRRCLHPSAHERIYYKHVAPTDLEIAAVPEHPEHPEHPEIPEPPRVVRRTQRYAPAARAAASRSPYARRYRAAQPP